MIDHNCFIPEEMMSAPSHPLANNIELPLPDLQQASVEEIRTIQRRSHIPGIVKRLIPLDTATYWEYWWCVPGRVLLPEDVELLQQDRARVEAIAAKLVWLWGGFCFGKDTYRDENIKPVYDWQEVIAFTHQQGVKPDFLDIDFLPLAINSRFRDSNSNLEPTPTHIAVEPNHKAYRILQTTTYSRGL